MNALMFALEVDEVRATVNATSTPVEVSGHDSMCIDPAKLVAQIRSALSMATQPVDVRNSRK